MNMKLTKLLAFVLVCIMTLGLLAACGSQTTTTPTTGSGTTAATTAAAGKTFKIGVAIWSTDDGLGADAKKAMDAAAAALNIELVYKTGDFDAESQITAFENFVAAGCDGIMVVTMVDTSTDELLKICEDAGVYMQVYFRNIIDQEAYNYCMNSKFFTGYVVEDEEKAGAAMVDALVASGSKSFGLLNREAGNGVTDRRQKGVQARLDELKLPYQISTNSSTATATDMTDATDQLLAAYPDIDALVISSGSGGAIDAIINDLEGSKVKITSFDTPADVVASFNKGNLVMLTTGAQIDPLYALVNLYSTLSGKPKSDKPTEFYSNYIYMTNADDAATYTKSFKEFKTYTADEIKALVDMDAKAFAAEIATYSLNKVK